MSIAGVGSANDPYVISAELVNCPLVSGGGGGGAGKQYYDGVVDNSVAADPANNCYNTVNEAVNDIGPAKGANSSIFLFIRSTGTTYTETVAQTYAFGSGELFITSGFAHDELTDNQLPFWNLAGFAITASAIHLTGIRVSNTIATTFPSSVNQLTAYHCRFQFIGAPGSDIMSAGTSMKLFNCILENCDFGCSNVVWDGGQYLGSNNTFTFSAGSGGLGQWYWRDIRFGGGTAINRTFPVGASSDTITLINVGGGQVFNTSSGILNATFPAGSNIYWVAPKNINSNLTAGQSAVVTDPVIAHLEGAFETVTATSSASINNAYYDVDLYAPGSSFEGPCQLQASYQQDDITGTDVINLSGDNIQGDIAINANIGGAAIGVDCNTMTNSNLQISAVWAAGVAATQKSLDLDAGCDCNVITLTGNDTWPVAFADAGTDNRVITCNNDICDCPAVTGGGGGGGGGCGVKDEDSFTETGGNYTLNSTTWANVDTSLDMVIDADEGDVLEIGLSGVWNTETVAGLLDVGTLVGGSIINTTSVPESGTSAGQGAWRSNATGEEEGFGGGVSYTVQAGDISGGTVTLRVRYRTTTASNKLLRANTNSAFQGWVINYGPVAGCGSCECCWADVIMCDPATGGPNALNDEFDDESKDADWVEVEPASPNVTWTEGKSLLSVFNPGGDATAELHGFVRPIGAASDPLTIETATRAFCQRNGTIEGMHGLIFADGTTHGAGTQVALLCWRNSAGNIEVSLRRITGYDTSAATLVSDTYDRVTFPWLHLQLVWEGTNTWGAYVSPDGVSWIQHATGQASTMTPTHAGVWESSWNTSQEQIVSFEYFRAIEG